MSERWKFVRNEAAAGRPRLAICCPQQERNLRESGAITPGRSSSSKLPAGQRFTSHADVCVVDELEAGAIRSMDTADPTQ